MRKDNLENIKLLQFKAEDVNEVVNMWNEIVSEDSIYAPMSVEEFNGKFLKNPHYKNEGSVIAKLNDEIIGYGNAIYREGSDPETAPGFISMICVKKEYQRNGIGTKILKYLENYLQSEGRKFIRNYFACPINLKWYIPGYDKHEHAGAPAVPYNTPYYFLLLANKYYSTGQQDGFHVDLTKFELTEEIKKKIAENEKDGYTITYYDPKLHYGFDEMFDALGNEGFRASVHATLAKPNPDPLLIVQKDGEILGFTGPVRTEPTGRAYLSGVAIHPKAQKRGLGKTMFCMLCQKSKENGATFMTLFTGSDNRARNIYLYAGLRIAQSFNILRKDFK